MAHKLLPLGEERIGFRLQLRRLFSERVLLRLQCREPFRDAGLLRFGVPLARFQQFALVVPRPLLGRKLLFGGLQTFLALEKLVLRVFEPALDAIPFAGLFVLVAREGASFVFERLALERELFLLLRLPRLEVALGRLERLALRLQICTLSFDFLLRETQCLVACREILLTTFDLRSDRLDVAACTLDVVPLVREMRQLVVERLLFPGELILCIVQFVLATLVRFTLQKQRGLVDFQLVFCRPHRFFSLRDFSLSRFQPAL